MASIAKLAEALMFVSNFLLSATKWARHKCRQASTAAVRSDYTKPIESLVDKC